MVSCLGYYNSPDVFFCSLTGVLLYYLYFSFLSLSSALPSLLFLFGSSGICKKRFSLVGCLMVLLLVDGNYGDSGKSGLLELWRREREMNNGEEEEKEKEEWWEGTIGRKNTVGVKLM